MINIIKTIIKSNKIFLIIGERLSTFLGLNFEKEYKIVSYIKDPKVIDVGAHLGESIKNFRKFSKNCKIFSFEPNTQLFNYIKKYFKSDNNVVIRNFAISKTKIKYLYIPILYSFEMRLWASYKINVLKNTIFNFSDLKKNSEFKKYFLGSS